MVAKLMVWAGDSPASRAPRATCSACSPNAATRRQPAWAANRPMSRCIRAANSPSSFMSPNTSTMGRPWAISRAAPSPAATESGLAL